MLSVKGFKPETTYPDYVPSTDETIKVWYVKNRFEDMRNARTVVDRHWDTYQTMIDATFTPYPDERSSSTVPLISSMIELYVADAIKLVSILQMQKLLSMYGNMIGELRSENK